MFSRVASAIRRQAVFSRRMSLKKDARDDSFDFDELKCRYIITTSLLCGGFGVVTAFSLTDKKVGSQCESTIGRIAADVAMGIPTGAVLGLAGGFVGPYVLPIAAVGATLWLITPDIDHGSAK